MHRQSRQIDFIAAVKCRKSNLIKRFGRKAEKNLFPLTQRSSLINFTFCVISFRIHVNLSIERERAISLGCALHKFPGSLLSRICVIRSIHLPWSETVVVHSPLTESALSCWSPGEITHKKSRTEQHTTVRNARRPRTEACRQRTWPSGKSSMRWEIATKKNTQNFADKRDSWFSWLCILHVHNSSAVTSTRFDV